ncbi:lasso peptide biosynthesis B2 protein [Sphingomonas sp. G124]|uniref:Lasso peptide biosynthesis B2 protein n=1 Tax=Sphingomonas cremea TaxID=2904799 RepID=A0A9X1TWQ9_9SPHN|nr:lasso peptide biosynthesis B2 protein [Sphingomonas cremea]MCF2514330.1 lasso peptide biosynthesis B2 protein [Sphingomonas cremea]
MTGKRSPLLRDYLRVAEASTALVLAAAIIALLPFRISAKTAAWRGFDRRRSDAKSDARQAVTAVQRAARRLPLRLVCIQQSLAVLWMLRRRGHAAQLHYGVRSGDGEISAHAWVSMDGQILIGEAEAGTHACVATFPAEAA